MVPPSPDAPPPSRLRRTWSHLRPLLIVFAVLATFRSSVADWNDVPTPSMEPTILTGDRILVNKLAYGLRVPFTHLHVARWRDPAPGDMVILRSPANGERLVKRVVGVPGDRIALHGNQLVRNGAPVPTAAATATDRRAAGLDRHALTDPVPHGFAVERLGSHDHLVMVQPKRRARRSFPEITIPGGHYFVMGDNRDNSGDSRAFGLVPRSAITGRVEGIAISFDRQRNYRPRWDRVLRGVE